MGWLFDHTQRGARERFAPDLIADPVISFVDRSFMLWSLLGLAIPFGLGYLIGGTLLAGLEGALWGGAVRVLVLHHATYSINSLCHYFGRRRFHTERPLAQPALADALHVRRGLAQQPPRLPDVGDPRPRPARARPLGRGDLQPWSGSGLAWDVRRISPESQATKSLAG